MFSLLGLALIPVCLSFEIPALFIFLWMKFIVLFFWEIVGLYILGVATDVAYSFKVYLFISWMILLLGVGVYF